MPLSRTTEAAVKARALVHAYMHSHIYFHLGKQNDTLILSNFHFVQEFDHNLDVVPQNRLLVDVSGHVTL